MSKNFNLLSEKIQSLTEDELKTCFMEFTDCNKKGFLPEDALIRTIRNEYSKELEDNYWDIACIFTSNEIMYEIAKRHFLA